MVAKKNTSASVVQACTSRVNALNKYLTSKDLIYVQGEQVKATDLVDVYQDALDTRAGAVTAKGAYKTALDARNTAEAKRLSTDGFLEAYVNGRFGASSTEAHDFGFAPRKVADKSVVTKAKATLLGQATRKARGTKGSVQKKGVQGTLTAEQQAALGVLATSGSGAPGSLAASPATETAPAAASMVAPVAPAVNGAAVNGAAHS